MSKENEVPVDVVDQPLRQRIHTDPRDCLSVQPLPVSTDVTLVISLDISDMSGSSGSQTDSYICAWKSREHFTLSSRAIVCYSEWKMDDAAEHTQTRAESFNFACT